MRRLVRTAPFVVVFGMLAACGGGGGTVGPAPEAGPPGTTAGRLGPPSGPSATPTPTPTAVPTATPTPVATPVPSIAPSATGTVSAGSAPSSAVLGPVGDARHPAMLVTLGLPATTGGSGTVQETVALMPPSSVQPLAGDGISVGAYVTFASNPTLTFSMTPSFSFAAYPTPTGVIPQIALNGCIAAYQNGTWQHVANAIIVYTGADFKAVPSTTTFSPTPTTYVYFSNSGGYASPNDPRAFC